MTNGPILRNVLRYSLPLMATGLLQLVYNAADIIVVARWAGGTALAAIGSNGPLINLVINLFIGLSVGASVTVSRYYGANDRPAVSRTVHTAMAVSVVSGLITLAVGLLVARQALEWMATPADVIDQAETYLRIYFLGMPACMIYNFGAAILRAVGDSRRPLYILILSGLVNVVLNLLLVIGFHWDVAGVAIATTVSQVLSAVLVVAVLRMARDSYRLEWKKLGFDRQKLREILHQGIPAGIQGSLFSLSNLLIQSSINLFGSAAMSGSAAAGNLEGFVYIAMNALYHTCMAFFGQNVGAGKPERFPKIFRVCLLTVTAVGVGLSALVFLLRAPLLSLYTAAATVETTIPAEQILYHGTVRLIFICLPYCLCGLMDTLVGALRGLGASWLPMLVTLIGACGLRIVWIFTVFQIRHTLPVLYFSYPVSWLVTALVHYGCYRSLVKKVSIRLLAQRAAAQAKVPASERPAEKTPAAETPDA